MPTSKAESIAANVSAALSSLASCLYVPEHFEPKKSRETFTFAATDYTAATILPGLIARMNSLAPGITLRLISSRDFNADENLLYGKVDFALGVDEKQKTPNAALSPSSALLMIRW